MITKAYLIPEETIRKTLPIKFETLMKKLKRKSFMKKIPVVFQFPKNISKEEWITVVNIKKSLETFGEDIKKNSQLLNQKNVKFIRIKPNAKFLPLSLKQKLLLAGLIPASVLSLITGYFLLLLPTVIVSIIPFIQNALIYSDFSWSKAMDTDVKYAPYDPFEDEDIDFAGAAGIYPESLLYPLDDN